MWLLCCGESIDATGPIPKEPVDIWFVSNLTAIGRFDEIEYCTISLSRMFYATALTFNVGFC